MKVEIKGLCKSFEDGAQVLKSVEFCDDIETMAIIGPSGDGKSTLLRILGGLILPTSGQFWMDGEEVSADEAGLIAYRRKIGFVFQQGGLFNHLTAMQNITLPLEKVHGMSEKDASARASELLERFGLAADGQKRPSELSGGQKQRIAIARAIAPKPKMLLLDEPTSALDPEYTNEVLDMVNELRQEGLHFIIVTHEMGFARHACKTAAYLCEGSICEYAQSSELFSNPKTPQLKTFLSRLLEWSV